MVRQLDVEAAHDKTNNSLAEEAKDLYGDSASTDTEFDLGR